MSRGPSKKQKAEQPSCSGRRQSRTTALRGRVRTRPYRIHTPTAPRVLDQPLAALIFQGHPRAVRKFGDRLSSGGREVETRITARSSSHYRNARRVNCRTRWNGCACRFLLARSSKRRVGVPSEWLPRRRNDPQRTSQCSSSVWLRAARGRVVDAASDGVEQRRLR